MTHNLFGFDVDKQWDYENGFYLTSHSTRLAKAVAHYELYKSIVDLPGHVVEFGVYKGASLIRFCTFREILESARSRRIIGFDAFGEFPDPKNESDTEFVRRFEQAGGSGIPVEELRRVMLHKGFENYDLVPGDIRETLSYYLGTHPELKVALLHIDVDVYQPTKLVLDLLFERVVRGGVIILDDYGTVDGATLAVDEFVADKDVAIAKLPISHVPAYIRKS